MKALLAFSAALALAACAPPSTPGQTTVGGGLEDVQVVPVKLQDGTRCVVALRYVGQTSPAIACDFRGTQP